MVASVHSLMEVHLVAFAGIGGGRERDEGGVGGRVRRASAPCLCLFLMGDDVFHPKKLAIAPVLDFSCWFPSTERP